MNTKIQANLIMMICVTVLLAQFSLPRAHSAEKSSMLIFGSIIPVQSPELPSQKSNVSLLPKEAVNREFSFPNNVTESLSMKADVNEFRALVESSKLSGKQVRDFLEVFGQLSAENNFAAEGYQIFLRPNRDLFGTNEDANGRSGKETTNNKK